ncbi:similar to cystatin T (predicted) [Rattus norvegicus]|uniref:Cystatin 13 n=2 Tax=Rattus norvegicus TaxID=10116 RepID=D3ZNB1_RAT|nr:cystatin-13 precursor [Rattus norvegicus]XP_006235224.1 cystatin-13 isoform X1 [Rattus norvegicus]EDL95083.1 similar to cystatin T (predicted) [Rattus norvegicus]|eukprot:NP_001102813.1 cystatin-13 precursor [Rattus norvegicus]
MARFLQTLMFLVITVEFVSRRVEAWGSPTIVRPFEDIPKSYVYVQHALWYAMKEYNKASNDQYNFKVVDILKSQEQITDSLEYYLEVNIARTMCKKIAGDNENCLIQNDPKMKKMVFCIFIVSSKPWKFELKMLKKQCKDI